MTEILVESAGQWQTRIRRVLGWIVDFLLFPIRTFLSVRRSATGASASLILILIISLNIVWGYPWTGVFSAALTMLSVGFLVNRLFAPRVQVEASPPAYSPVGQLFDVPLHLRQRGRLPAFDLRLLFRDRIFHKSELIPNDQKHETVSFLGQQHFEKAVLSLVGKRRGIHQLPDIDIRSTFPFHFFESRQRANCDDSIAITPEPIDQSNDDRAEPFIDQVSRWTQRWLSGECYDYAGNREYIVGMPVRRWDFRSWARLGRPIVQEFQTPSLRCITLIVDTAIDPGSSGADAEERFEFMLRVIATSVHQWHRQSIAVRMMVTSEVMDHDSDQQGHGLPPGPAVLLVQLAAANRVTCELSDQRIIQAMDLVNSDAVVLFTTRAEVGSTLPSTKMLGQVKLICFADDFKSINPGHAAESQAHNDAIRQTPTAVTS